MATQQHIKQAGRCVAYSAPAGRDLRADLYALRQMGADTIQAPLEFHAQLKPLCAELGLSLQPADGCTVPGCLADYEYALVSGLPLTVPFWEKEGCCVLQPDGQWGDLYYLCRSFWSREPFVYLSRTAIAASRGTVVKAYSNLPAITLLVNGRVTEKRSAAHIFVFEDVPVRLIGRNILAVQNGECRDSVRFERTVEQMAPREE